MLIMVIDIGNSNLKIHIWRMGRSPSLIYDHVTPTSPRFADNLEVIDNAFKNREADGYIVLSMSDSIIYETATGEPIRLQHNEPSHPYFRGDLPSYVECGLPRANPLGGMLNQVSMVKHLLRSEHGFRKNPKRILPVSTYVATHLAKHLEFNQWDITHATNSGFFNSQRVNPTDDRFPLAGWHKCVDDIIEDELLNPSILPSHHRIGNKVFIGGHDSTFANAMDVPYGTKPYISCGTWLTVSRETAVSRNWKDDGTRNIAAPNGAMLNQLCVPSDRHSTNKAIAHIKKHFTKYSASIRIFGAYAKTVFNEFDQLRLGLEVPGRDTNLGILNNIDFELMPKNYLSLTAARFVEKHL